MDHGSNLNQCSAIYMHKDTGCGGFRNGSTRVDRGGLFCRRQETPFYNIHFFIDGPPFGIET
jgi:hypothetical protein